jgi:chromosomal replication initiation ATPase DnaA
VDLNPRFHFDAFVVGASNRLAATAARAVAESPGAVYNPLFVYAKSGLGKTHLLQAIGFEALAQQPNLRVQYVTLEEFVEQYHTAVAAGQSDAFRRTVQEVDVLLLDDVQFLAERAEMQAELLRVSEALQAAGRQLVLTSDRPPAEIHDLDERLITRLAGGLLVDIAAPDVETRLAILRRKAEERGIRMAPGVLEAAAEFGVGNVRELIGLVNRLIAFQAASETPLTPDAARALLGGAAPAAAPAAEPPAEVPPAPAEPLPAAALPAVEAEQPPPAALEAAPPEQAAAPPPVPAAAEARPLDDFSSFLSVVSQSVARHVEAWRGRIGEAVVRWQGQGFRTHRLEQLLTDEEVADADAVLAGYESDVAELRALAETAANFDAAAAGSARFKDPDRIAEARAFVARLREGTTPPPAPSGALTFEGFIAGSTNDGAVKAAKAVAAEPGHKFNPLFLVGAVGSGKTHLLHAVGNGIALARPGTVVACVSAQTFFEELVAAIHGERADWWRRRYRGADALLLDDVQLLAGKERTQEELFNLFNAFQDAGKQLVFSADRQPLDLEGVAPRLVSRFSEGLVVGLGPPDREMRAEMVRRLLAAQNVCADPGAVDYIASRPADGARAVAGLVNRVVTTIDPTHETLTVLMARIALEGDAGRVSAILAAASVVPDGLDPLLRSREKVVWDWPDVGERLIEDLR